MFRQLFPIISTPDVERSLRFYRDLLGASIRYRFDGPDGQPLYVGLKLGESEVGIGQETDGEAERLAGRVSLWVYVDDCDAAVERLREGGTQVVEEPTDQPWGERVARVRDPDGIVLFVASAERAG